MRKISLWLTVGFIAYLFGISFWLITRGANEIAIEVRKSKTPHIQIKQSIMIISKSGIDTIKLSENARNIETIKVVDLAEAVVLVENWQDNTLTAIAEDMGRISIICTDQLNRLNIEVYDMAVINVQCKIDTLHVSGKGVGKIKLSGEYNYVEGFLSERATLESEDNAIINNYNIEVDDEGQISI